MVTPSGACGAEQEQDKGGSGDGVCTKTIPTQKRMTNVYKSFTSCVFHLSGYSIRRVCPSHTEQVRLERH